jgi:hypothetical protein
MHGMAKKLVDQAMARRLVEARELAGYADAADAARALNIPYSTYKNYEDGHRGFKEHAEKFAKKFHVDVIWLLYGKGMPRGRGIENRIRSLSEADQATIMRMIEAFESKPSNSK